MSKLRPAVFVLHDRDSSDAYRVAGELEIPKPFRIKSYTDTHPDENPRNADLSRNVFREADYLLFQDSLLDPFTELAKSAIATSMFSSVVRTEYGIFDNDYWLRRLDFDEAAQLCHRALGWDEFEQEGEQ